MTYGLPSAAVGPAMGHVTHVSETKKIILIRQHTLSHKHLSLSLTHTHTTHTHTHTHTLHIHTQTVFYYQHLALPWVPSHMWEKTKKKSWIIYTVSHTHTPIYTHAHIVVDHHTNTVFYHPLLRPVCCSVLQCVAVCCSVLQCVAVCCSVWCWPSH